MHSSPHHLEQTIIENRICFSVKLLIEELKISVKTKILLVGNALLSLVNLYAQVTKKCPIFY